MKKLSFSYLSQWLLTFIELQLFLTCLSLPILIAWGLPISLLALVGNLIFTPFLAAFLLLSSFLFFTEILHIPNQALIYCLEQIGNLWLYVLNFAHKGWLISYPQPPYWLLFLIATIAILIILLRDITQQWMRIAAFLGLLFFFYGLLHLCFAQTNKPFFIEYSSGSISALYCHKQLVVVESGALARMKSADSWIDYTLIPALMRATGKTTIDHLIVCNVGPRIFQGIATLITKIPVKRLYLIVWEGQLNPSGWHHYFTLCTTAAQQGCTIIRIGLKERSILIDDHACISIKPTAGTIKKGDVTIAKVDISYSIDNNTGTLYAAS